MAARGATLGFKLADVSGYFYSGGQPHWTEFSFENFAKEAYRGNPYGYAAIRMVISAIASIRLEVRQGSGKTAKEAPEGHPLRRLIAHPNERQSWNRFLDGFVGGMLVGGQGFAYAVGPEKLAPGQKPSQGKPPRELWALRPDLVAPNPGELVGEVLSFTYRPKGQTIPISSASMLWLSGWDPLDEAQGLPPAAAAGKGFDVNNEAMAYNKCMLENGGVPGLVFTAPAGEKMPVFANDEERKHYAEQFDMRFGKSGRGRSAVLYGGMDVKDLGRSPKEMSWKDAIEQSATQIGLVYGVAPELLGIASQKTYSNVREARAALYQETVIPLVTGLCGELSRFWKPWDPSISVSFNPEEIEALQEDQNQKWTRITAADDLTVNEKREARGYDPVPGGDVILVPAGKMPLEMVTGAPDIAAKP